MRLYHCPRDGQLLVRDSDRWFCLFCGFTLVESKSEPAPREFSWPPEANPMHEKHTQGVPHENLDEE